jgi:hypothetical protein
MTIEPIHTISKYPFPAYKSLINCHGFVVHAISEYIHRDGLKSYPRYNIAKKQYNGVPLDDYPEWIIFDQWLSLINLSVHTCIDPSGGIIRCVPDSKVAMHAGQSAWGAFNGLNYSFLGSELVMPGQNKYSDFVHHLDNHSWVSVEQYKSLALLVKQAMIDRKFPKENIIGHSQCAGDHIRGVGKGKKDPGALFNWDKLHYYINSIS